MQRIIKTIIQQILENVLGPLRVVLIHYNDPSKIKDFDLCRQIRKESKTLLTEHELYNLYRGAHSVSPLDGAFAEVGVFKGGSAKLLCEAKGNKTLYLFDTFLGLPQGTEKDDPFHKNNKGLYAENIRNVKRYLNKYKKVIIKQGIFPDNVRFSKYGKFCFVHVDIDLYEGTIQSMNYFWPKMVKNGIIMIHDYPALAGVKNAVLDFCRRKNAMCIEIPPMQAMLIKK